MIFVPFLKSWPATIPCKRKKIKWATKLLIEKKGKGKKRGKEKDLACVHARNSFSAILMPISQKSVQGTGFLATRQPSPKD